MYYRWYGGVATRGAEMTKPMVPAETIAAFERDGAAMDAAEFPLLLG